MLLFASLALASSPAVAEVAKDAAESPPAKIEVIAPADIAVQADIDERFLQDVARRARQPYPGKLLEAQLLEQQAGIARLEGRFRDTNLKTLPTTSLESLERHWKFYGRQMREWRAQLQDTTQPFSDSAAGLARRRVVWVATRNVTETEALAPALLQRIDFIIGEIDRVDGLVSVPLGTLIDLGRQGNALQARVELGQKAVDAAIKYQDRRLWMVDSPPLWAARQELAGPDSVTGNVLAGLEVERAFIEEYSEAHLQRLGWQALLGVFLLPFLLWLSRRTRQMVFDDPAVQESVKVLLRPVSSWVALTMLGLVVLEPDAPVLRHKLALLVALIPVLRMLPRPVFSVLGTGPGIFVALYFANAMGMLLTVHSLWLRVHVLCVNVLLLATVLWLLLRSRKMEGEREDTLARLVVRGLGWFAVIALLVGALANIFGNVSLAIMLTSGTLDGVCQGLILFAAAAALGAVVKMLLSRRRNARQGGVSRHVGPLLQATGRLIWAGALIVWVFMTLNAFRVLRPVVEWLRGVLTYKIEAGEVTITLGGTLLFVFAVYLAFWAARMVRVVLAEDVLPRMSLPRGVDNSISTLTYYALLLLGLVASLAVVGFRISELAFIFGALGVGIGFGLQNVVNNFVSGLILMFERPVQPGDVVEVSGTAGTVREIGMRATTIKTFEGAEVVVPNGTLLSDKLINWTLSDRNRRLDVAVGVAYGTDPRRVIELLLETARETPGVVRDPEPVALFVGFGASSLDFAVRAWTFDFDNWVRIRSDLTVRVHDALKVAGVEIPFPQQDLHLRTVSAAAAAALASQPGMMPPRT